MAGANQQVTVDGRSIAMTNLDKVLYPETQTTKADVLAYYAEVAHVLLPHVSDRPATRKRWVNGVGTREAPGSAFFNKGLGRSVPDWVRRGEIRHADHVSDYPLINDTATLMWLGQLAALEIHVPQWRFDHTGHPRNPDRLVLDLDPGEGIGLAHCAEVAFWIREVLTGVKLDPVPVTSGSKGIHLYSRLDGSLTPAQATELARELAAALQADHPGRIVTTMRRADRTGKVFIDWSQNNGAKTTVSPYSLRGQATATVAAPRTWEEIADSGLRQLRSEEVVDRIADVGDLFAAMSLSPGASEARSVDRLATYRGMRDPARTPEPVPAEPPRDEPVNRSLTFVIQEHHARRLHYDFRLERDGVLVSWAVPKGPPTDSGANRLAVQTEDHPMEYAAFEGTIPSGEYGGGRVHIWDSGSYELHKWRPGREIIVTLHGRPDGGLGGTRKFALIHTGGRGQPEKNWLMHLMRTD